MEEFAHISALSCIVPSITPDNGDGEFRGFCLGLHPSFLCVHLLGLALRSSGEYDRACYKCSHELAYLLYGLVEIVSKTVTAVQLSSTKEYS